MFVVLFIQFYVCLQKVHKKHIGSTYTLQSAKQIESASREIIQKIFHTSTTSTTNDKQHHEIRIDESNADAKSVAIADDGEASRSETKVHFVEIGTFSCGATFGLGEQMEDRVIIAQHNGVQCLTIPRYWLFQKQQNSGNIWHRFEIKFAILFLFMI